MTTKAYWPQRVESVQMDMRDHDGRPDTSESWMSDDDDSDLVKKKKGSDLIKKKQKGNVQVRSTDVEKNNYADSKTSGDDVVGSTSLYDENGKIRLVPVALPLMPPPLTPMGNGLIMLLIDSIPRSKGFVTPPQAQMWLENINRPGADPLNLPNWRKWVAIGSMCLCKSSTCHLDLESMFPFLF